MPDTGIDAILDRLPTAKILDGDESSCAASVKVFDKGIEMWLKS